MNIRLSELLKQIAPTTAGEVEGARRRWNGTIREALRRESGLRIKRQDSAPERRLEKVGDEGLAVPIQLMEGLPALLREIELTPPEAGALLIGQWRPALQALKAGGQGVQEMLQSVGSRPEVQTLLGTLRPDLGSSLALANALLKVLDQHDPVRKILAVRGDVLGVYRCAASPQATLLSDGVEPVAIELYWGIIGLVSRNLGIEVEALSIVVLAHELAHAYTHLGLDIDGHRWDTAAFRDTEGTLKEGLAQYYTERVCGRISSQQRGAPTAYEALLRHQPPPYKVHVKWTRDYRPEEVRVALLETRRRGRASLADFETALGDARKRLRS
jgi:hypothetical protein